MDILVIGSTGLVGSNVYSLAIDRGHEVTGTFHTEGSGQTEYADYRLDKTDENAVADLITDVRPDAVVDTAAFHNVDACETNRDRAWTVNAQGTHNVATTANSVDAHYLFLSTDYVFPGNLAETPYDEDDPISPVNYYGQTKYSGEQAAKITSDWTVLRTSVVYGTANQNFVSWVLSELQEGNEIGIVDDQTSTPTYAPDLARACVDIVENGVSGLYHATGPTSISRYEFTRYLAEAFGCDVDLVDPISTDELGQEAPRPTDGSLDSTRLYETLDWEFTQPKEAFATMAEGE
jgi:dTDP-4-dehydrorhamnose reductase